jgi:hypothetical protein
VEKHRDARIAADIPRSLALRLGVDEQVFAIGVDPGQQCLGLAVGHQRHDGRESGSLGKTDNVGVERHAVTPAG